MSDLSAEFDVVMRVNEIQVPAEWQAGTLAGYAELRCMVALLRRPRHVESEPAAVYRVSRAMDGNEEGTCAGTP
jgi:hypothetical protein